MPFSRHSPWWNLQKPFEKQRFSNFLCLPPGMAHTETYEKSKYSKFSSIFVPYRAKIFHSVPCSTQELKVFHYFYALLLNEPSEDICFQIFILLCLPVRGAKAKPLSGREVGLLLLFSVDYLTHSPPPPKNSKTGFLRCYLQPPD